MIVQLLVLLVDIRIRLDVIRIRYCIGIKCWGSAFVQNWERSISRWWRADVSSIDLLHLLISVYTVELPTIVDPALYIKSSELSSDLPLSWLFDSNPSSLLSRLSNTFSIFTSIVSSRSCTNSCIFAFRLEIQFDVRSFSFFCPVHYRFLRYGHLVHAFYECIHQSDNVGLDCGSILFRFQFSYESVFEACNLAGDRKQVRGGHYSHRLGLDSMCPSQFVDSQGSLEEIGFKF